MRTNETTRRGPAEHERRDQIVAAANDHFRHYGYHKTTVADLAKAIGLSTAYIYKFFDSKQSIGEAICRSCLTKIMQEVDQILAEPRPASDRLRRILQIMAKRKAELFFEERKMHELVASSFADGWKSAAEHDAVFQDVLTKLLQAGRDAGEFERKTPMTETVRATYLAFMSFQHPMLLEKNLDTISEDVTLLANMVLRSLAV